jgi:RNA polymerase sigma-70 factor (sigma-E family)
VADPGNRERRVEIGTVDGLDLESLYATHWTRLVRLAVLLVDDVGLAEDVVQDAFIGLHRHQANLRSTATAAGYLRTSVVNGARTQLRRRVLSRRHLATLADRAVTVAGADAEVILTEQNQELMAQLRRLPRRQREVLVLRYWAHLTEAEIAETLGISVGTVKSSASRGLDALEATLGGAR